MNVAFSIVLLFILLDCVMNEKPPCAKGCHVPLTAFYRPVKALFRFMSVMMLQTKCKLNNTDLFLKLFHIQSKEIGSNKYYEETTELEKWQNEILPEY